MALIDSFLNASSGNWNADLLRSYWDHMKTRVQYSDDHFDLFGQLMQKVEDYPLSDDNAYYLLDIWVTMTFEVDTIKWRRFSPTRTNTYLSYFVDKHPKVVGQYLESRKLGKGLDERFSMHAIMLLSLLHDSKSTVTDALQEQLARLAKRTLRRGSGLFSLPSYTDLLPLPMLYDVAQTQDKPTSKALQMWAAYLLAKRIQRTSYPPELEHPEWTWSSIAKTSPEVLQWATQGSTCKKALEAYLGKPHVSSATNVISDDEPYIENVRMMGSQLYNYVNNEATNEATRLAADVLWENLTSQKIGEERSTSGTVVSWKFAKTFGHRTDAAKEAVDTIKAKGWSSKDFMSELSTIMLFKEHPVMADLLQEAQSLAIQALLTSLDKGDTSNKPQIIKYLKANDIAELMQPGTYPNETPQLKEMLFWNLIYGGHLTNEVMSSLGENPQIQPFIFGKTFLDSVGVHEWKSHSAFDSLFERPWLTILQRLYPTMDWSPVNVALFEDSKKGDYAMLETTCTALHLNYDAVMGLQSIYDNHWVPKKIETTGAHQFERSDDFQCGWLSQEGWLVDFYHSIRKGVQANHHFQLPGNDFVSDTSVIRP